MKKKIKIFVTHRIDKESVVIENDIITPIRCGAVYDKSESKLLGDNTGDNISEKRNTHCELTTQYWAWKNVEADYYGFCHYRRYFSFSDTRFDADDWSTVCMDYLDQKAIEKLSLDEESIYKKVTQYDVIAYEHADLKKVGVKSVYEQYKTGPKLFIKDLDCILEIIGQKYPEFSDAAREYINGTKCYFCNMFIMRKDLFYDYNKWLFDILSEFEKKVDMTYYSIEGLRTPGHLGERLFGIYFTYLKNQKKYKVCELQVATFKDTSVKEEIEPFSSINNIPIVMSSSEYFMPYCGTTIRSIVEHSSKEYSYDIIILEKEVQEKTKKLIKKVVQGYDNFSIRFVNVSRWFNSYNLTENRHISVETYFRLIIPELLSKYEKTLYLDGDLIVKADVAELYNTDLTGYFIAGVVDVVGAGLVNGFDNSAKEYCIEKLRLKNRFMQFNAGVMVINIDELKKTFSSQYLLDFAERGQFTFQDQDVLNILCQGKIKWLDPAWNFFADDINGYRGYVATYAPKEMYDAYRKAESNVKIYHFAGAEKPWYEPTYEYADEFWDTLRRTPFYEIVIHRRIVENAWHIANQVIANGNKPKSKVKALIRKVGDILLPRNTKRRKAVGEFYYRLRGWK